MASTATQSAKRQVSDTALEPEQRSPAEKSPETMEPGNMSEDPNQQEIARRAYFFWEAREGSNGSAEDDWLRAEADLHGSPPQDKK